MAAKKGPTRDSGGRFVKGQSGNLSGKPAGTANRRTREVRDLLDRLTPAVLKKLYELLQQGDPVALRILADRTLPKRRLLQVDLPPINGLADVAKVQKELAALVTTGEIDVGEAADLATVIDKHGAALERAELERRIQEIEARLEGGKK